MLVEHQHQQEKQRDKKEVVGAFQDSVFQRPAVGLVQREVEQEYVVHENVHRNDQGIQPRELKVENAQEKPEDDGRQGADHGKEKKTVDHQHLFPGIGAQEAQDALLDPTKRERTKQHGGIKNEGVFAIFRFSKEPDSQDDDCQVGQGRDNFSREVDQDVFFHGIVRLAL